MNKPQREERPVRVFKDKVQAAELLERLGEQYQKYSNLPAYRPVVRSEMHKAQEIIRNALDLAYNSPTYYAVHLKARWYVIWATCNIHLIEAMGRLEKLPELKEKYSAQHGLLDAYFTQLPEVHEKNWSFFDQRREEVTRLTDRISAEYYDIENARWRKEYNERQASLNAEIDPAIPVTSMQHDAFVELLNGHDYHYSYSDDIGVWRRGEAQRNRILEITKKHPHFAELWQICVDYHNGDLKKDPTGPTAVADHYHAIHPGARN